MYTIYLFPIRLTFTQLITIIIIIIHKDNNLIRFYLYRYVVLYDFQRSETMIHVIGI